MALGKNRKEETKEQVQHEHLTWVNPNENMEKVEVRPGITRYQISRECSVTIYNDHESVNVNIWGFSIWANARETQDGHIFLAWPSYKKKDGSYGNYVTCLDKSFNDMITELLEKHFA